MYSLTGTLDGVAVDVLWDDGHVDGSPGIVDILRAELKADPRAVWGVPSMPGSSGLDVLADGLAFFCFFRSIVTDAVLHDGELPPITPVPVGAVS